MKRIITIVEGEETDDYENNQKYFEFESPTKPAGEQ